MQTVRVVMRNVGLVVVSFVVVSFVVVSSVMVSFVKVTIRRFRSRMMWSSAMRISVFSEIISGRFSMSFLMVIFSIHVLCQSKH